MFVKSLEASLFWIIRVVSYEIYNPDSVGLDTYISILYIIYRILKAIVRRLSRTAAVDPIEEENESDDQSSGEFIAWWYGA